MTILQVSEQVYYYNGLDEIIKPNWQQARFWFHRAAKQGDAIADYYLGEIHAHGHGLPVNRKEAFKWYKRSADKHYVPAQQKLAHCYLHGIGTRKNETEGYILLASLALWGDEESEILLRSAAASGNPAAGYGMWLYYRERRDIETGRGWLEKSADKGHANALCALAILYDQEGEREQKLRYLQLAAKKGHADAQFRLGLLLENVSARKAPENEAAFKWMKASAEQGHPHANYCLGNLYRDGTWVDADVEKAVECYFHAAAMGDADGIDRLGECYAYGTGLPKDETLAFQYFEYAAAMGNPKGQCHLGLSYLTGLGCCPDMTLAFRWISCAAGSGEPIVFKTLQSFGLDVGMFIGGYRQSRKRWTAAAMQDDRLGLPFEDAFESSTFQTSPGTIQAIPPGGMGGNADG